MSTPNPQHRLIRGADISGLPVVCIDSGDAVADVRDVVFDGHNHKLVGFTLNKRGWFRGTLKKQLDATDVHAIGPDAVVVGTEADLTEDADAAPALVGDAETHEVIGNRVLTAEGVDFGQVSGVVVSTKSSPKAVGYEIATSDGDVFVPITAELAVSGENLMLPASASDFIDNDLVGFGAAVSRFHPELAEGVQ